MEKKVFEKIISLKKNVDEVINKFEKEFKIQIYDTEFVESFYELFDITISNEYTTEGVDNINWFLYEKFFNEDEPLKAFDHRQKEIMYDEDSLYEYVEKFNKKIINNKNK